jgi:molybdenum cofactor biosynthesis enzyme
MTEQISDPSNHITVQYNPNHEKRTSAKEMNARLASSEVEFRMQKELLDTIPSDWIGKRSSIEFSEIVAAVQMNASDTKEAKPVVVHLVPVSVVNRRIVKEDEVAAHDSFFQRAEASTGVELLFVAFASMPEPIRSDRVFNILVIELSHSHSDEILMRNDLSPIHNSARYDC